jgi:hypothetical protein
MPANDAIKTVFSRQDVSIMETKACYAGFLILDKLTLKHRLYEGGWSACCQGSDTPASGRGRLVI